MASPNMQVQARDGVELATPAKINLYLQVLNERPDGFHEIQSLALAVGLYDALSFCRAPSEEVDFTCDAGLPEDGGNLVVQAACALAERTGCRQGARIGLRKSIPVSAGLGGGSSDAAATLRGLNSLWQTGLSDGELAALGAQLGSDVALFFDLPAAVLSGRGEQTAPVAMAWSGWVLLVMGGWPVSTAEVYRRWEIADSPCEGGLAAIDALNHATCAGSLMPLCRNDLEPAVYRVCPEVRRLREQVSECLDQPARVSGAGSTVFTLYDDKPAAQSAAEALTAEGLRATVVCGGREVMVTP
ncbi:MAG: 4-(cytidine 5'-diphospho)-2-C-methyl-D-erythritol kinase [Phycisphaerae bacterium]